MDSIASKDVLQGAIQVMYEGRWADAIGTFEGLFRKALADGESSIALEALRRIGYCYRYLHDTELATEYLQLALELALLHEDFSSASRALTGLGTFSQHLGELDIAEQQYLEARSFGIQANDQGAIGDVEQNLGTLATIRGSHNQALSRYTSALTAYEKSDNQLGIASVSNNLGMVYIDLERLDDAQRALERALVVCRANANVVTEEIVLVNMAELFLARELPDRARACCDEAFEIASKLGDRQLMADVLKMYGVIFKASSKLQLADLHLRQAIEMAAENSNPLTEAESHRELALVLRELGRNKESLEALNRAHGLFAALRARHDQADIAKRVSQLEKDFLVLVRAWGESIEAKDRYTSGHCQRVADYACMIAEAAGMSATDLVWFRMGAFLHDVGKTEVPSEILNKPGRLTEEERSLIERHTIMGDEILSSIEFPWDVRPMVRSHHERWDGTGYPDHLAGAEIPLSARILRIADVFDALTTTRSYRAPLTPEQAKQLMEGDVGSFDPELFTIFRSLFPKFQHVAAAVEPHSASDG